MINDSINRFLGVLCYPFASLEFFQKDLIDEYIKVANKQTDNEPIKSEKEIKQQLQNQLIEYIRQSYDIYSYDEIYLYLEKCYLYDTKAYQDALQLYWEVMKKMAETLISHRDGRIVFKYWENKEDEHLFGGFAGNNKVNLFHSLNCHIPLDVIAIVHMVIKQKEFDVSCLDYFYGNIKVADGQLSRILEQGVAENHLHKGVSRTFSSIWDSLMEPLTARRGKAFQNKKFVNSTEEQNKHIIFYILGCGIVRGALIFEMWNEKSGKKTAEPEEIKKLREEFQNGQAFEDNYQENYQKKDTNEIISYYVSLWELMEKILPERAFEERLCSLVLGEDLNLHTFDENVFLYYVFNDMEYENMAYDRSQCILQYLRVRNYLFHISVQQKTIKGLDYFQEAHYHINSVLNHINIENFWENAIREQLQNRDLAKVEFRSSMLNTYSEFKKEVLKFLKAYKKILEEDYCYFDGENYIPNENFPQVGLVIHFLKQPDKQMYEKCFQNGKSDCSYYQFGKLQEYYRNQIDAFIQLRSEFSELSRYLVGIDAASLENSTPVWVFVPIYAKARDSKIEQIGRSKKDRGYTQSLGFTFHAGEDFRHILSGLRRIDEAVTYLKFHAGDRIGHGIALGVPPKIWKNQNPVIIIPRIEALENYLWAYDMLSKNFSDFQTSILAYMEQRIFELSQNIYGESTGITIEMLIAGYQRMFDIEAVEQIVQDNEGLKRNLCQKLQSEEKINWDAGLLVAARHCKIYVKRMEQPIHYEITEQDLFIIEKIQEILKEKLGNKGIVIEVNPSSNTAIADLDVLKENQLYKINELYNENNLIVCINSDDPAVFNTNVSNELAYIYYGMLEQDISREAALRWIERIRKNGMDSSFIHHQESGELLIKKLSDLIEQM